MGLTETNIATLKACHPLLLAKKDELGSRFYHNLFTRHPEVKPMFSKTEEGRKRQAKALAGAVIAYCNKCDDIQSLVPTVTRIAKKHVRAGVTPELYSVVGGNLLLTLEEILGTEVFTEAIKKEVAEGYFFLADIFIGMEKQMYHDRKMGLVKKTVGVALVGVLALLLVKKYTR